LFLFDLPDDSLGAGSDGSEVLVALQNHKSRIAHIDAVVLLLALVPVHGEALDERYDWACKWGCPLKTCGEGRRRWRLEREGDIGVSSPPPIHLWISTHPRGLKNGFTKFLILFSMHASILAKKSF